MEDKARLITVYEEAIAIPLNRKIIIMGVPLIVYIGFFAVIISPTFIFFFITNEPFAVIMCFYSFSAFFLILGVIATWIRNKNNRDRYKIVWNKIKGEKDQPYLYNKYIYDNINFHKYTKIGHAKTICKIFSIFQIFTILKIDKGIAKIYGGSLLTVGLLSTAMLIMLHCSDERLEALKIALQFSQENAVENKVKGEPQNG